MGIVLAYMYMYMCEHISMIMYKPRCRVYVCTCMYIGVCVRESEREI